MSPPDVSVLLVSWNTRDLTLACLDALPAAAGEGCRYETIVVDNGSRDGSGDALAQRQGIELVRNESNRGYAAAVNQAYRSARGELVLLLNSDVRLWPGSLGALVRFLRGRGEAAGVAPLYVNPDGSPQPYYHRLPTFATALALATGLRLLPPFRRRFRAYLMLDDDFSQARRVPQPSASCLLLRRSCLPEADLLDERYPIFFNDVDLARRLAAADRELWMTPAAVAEHELGASTRLLGPALARHHLGALIRYVAATQPAHRLLLLQALALLDRLVRRPLRKSGSLPLRELWTALRGDPGPLPDLNTAGWVVFFSGIRWGLYRHRQHELAAQLAHTRRVLFVDPPGLRPSWRLKIEPISAALWRASPPAPVPLGRFLPPANWVNRRIAAWLLRDWLDDYPGQRLLWIDEDLAAPVIGRVGETACVYDAADLDWTFARRWNRWHLKRALARAVQQADLVLASSPVLAKALAPPGSEAVELLNACDPEHFAPEGPVDRVLASIPRPRLGYAGALDERAFDATFVARAAALRRDWSFVLVGPATATARRALGGVPNVHLRAPVAYEALPAVLRSFDVCLIPYRSNGRAAYVFPKKLYEYLAVGKPVVATPLPALAESDAPHGRGGTPEDFVAAVEAALTSADVPGEAGRRRVAACSNSWDARGAHLRALLDTLESQVA